MVPTNPYFPNGGITPFPYQMQPMNATTPLTFREGITFQGMLEQLRDWVQNSVAVEFQGAVEKALEDFQAGITNAEETIIATQLAWSVANDAFTTAVDDRMELAEADIANEKVIWQNLFDDFMADVVAQIGVLNDAAIRPIAADVTEKSVGPDVRAYGVALNGTTDATAAFQLALNAATALGVPLRLPVGRYLLDNVTIPTNGSIVGSGPGTVIIQRMPNRPALSAKGTITTLGPTTKAILGLHTSIAELQTWGLVSGDLIIVSDNTSYAATDAGYKSGEMLRVASSTSSVIILDSRVRGSFTHPNGAYTVPDGTLVKKINKISNVSISDVSFTGHATASSPLIDFNCVENLTLDKFSVTFANSTFALIANSRNVNITNFNIVNIVDNIALGNPGYGFAIMESCYNVTIRDGFSNRCRHIVTTMGGANGIPRLLTFGPNIVSSGYSVTTHLDTHSAAEGVHIHGNVLRNGGGGISNRGRNIVVENNDISNVTESGILVNEGGRDIVIKENRITGAQLGVRVGAGGSTHSNVAILNNVIKNNIGDSISTQAGVTDIRIHNNVVDTSGTHGIIIGDNNAKVSVTDNYLNDITGQGILATTGTDGLIIDDNKILRASSAGIRVPVTNRNVTISENKIIDCSTAGVVPGIECTGVQTVGYFDFIENTIKQTESKMNRAISTSATVGKMVQNKAIGPFASVDTEFESGVGMTNADNKVYN